jgi:hypothetical protein
VDRPPPKSDDGCELVEGGLQILNDAGGEGVGAFKALVTQPEEVEADFVAFEEFVVGDDIVGE